MWQIIEYNQLDKYFLVLQGPQDYIKISIIGGVQLQFQYQAGNGPLGLAVETSYKLSDNNWHSVSVERNR